MWRMIISEIVVGVIIAVGSWWLIRHVRFNKKPPSTASAEKQTIPEFKPKHKGKA